MRVDLPSCVQHIHYNNIPSDQYVRIVLAWEEVLPDEGARMMMMMMMMVVVVDDDDNKGIFHNKDIVVEGLQLIAVI